jgi:hypothetical protein
MITMQIYHPSGNGSVPSNVVLTPFYRFSFGHGYNHLVRFGRIRSHNRAIGNVGIGLK